MITLAIVLAVGLAAWLLAGALDHLNPASMHELVYALASVLATAAAYALAANLTGRVARRTAAFRTRTSGGTR